MSSAGKVYVVDDEAPVRKALERLLRAAGFEAELNSSAQEFLARSEGHNGGCVVLDYRMPGLSGLDLQDVLAARDASWQIVFLTGRGDIETAVKAIQAGAVDFLEKPVDQALLLSAVRRALLRAAEVDVEKTFVQAIRARLATLSGREREVMGHVIAGRLNKQIADRLGTSEKTVKVQRAAVMEKTGAKSVAELVLMATRAGMEPTSP